MIQNQENPLKALQDLSALLVQVFQLPVCSIGIFTTTDTAHLVSHGLPQKDERAIHHFVQEALDKNELVVIEQLHESDVFTPCKAEVITPLASFMGCMVCNRQGHRIGFLSAFSPSQRSFSDQEKSILKGFAQQAAVLSSLLPVDELSVPVGTEDLFQRVISQGRAQLCVHSAEGRLLYVNQSACDSLGYSAENVLQKKLTDLMPVANVPDYAQYMRRIGKMGMLDGIIELVDRSGKRRYWSYNNALDPKNGNVVSFSLDITSTVNERKQISNRETAVKKARGLAAKGAWSLNPKDESISLSAEAQAIFGADAHKADTLKGYLSLVHAKDRAEFEVKLQAAMASNGHFLVEHRYLSTDKNLKHLAVNGQIQRSADGSPLLVKGFIEDISHKVNWEKELLRRKETSGELSALKQEFLANMSHEIRTPVSSVIGFSRLLLAATLGEQERKYAELIYSAGDSLLTLVNDVLDFSKMEAGELYLKEQAYPIRSSLADLISKHQEEAQNKGLSLLFTMQDSLPQATFGDEQRVSQIVSNLLSNAIKFTSNGYIELAAQKVTEGSKQLLEFKVSDSGIGIEHSKLGHIFNSFQQAEGSHTRTYGGTGLGLSITRELIDLMGGTIEVKSTPGQGSVFTVRVPYKVVDTSQESKKQVSSIASKFDFSDYRILMAEDNANNQLLAQAYLKRVQANLDIANDGVEALELLEKNAYDLVLMDIQMPRMGGIECAEKIRSQSKWNHLPIVAITAHAFPEDKERTTKAGMNAHLTKPFKPEILYQTIASMLGTMPEAVAETKEKPQRFDLQHILGYAMNDEDLFMSLLQTLSKSLPKNIAGIETGIKNKDLSLVKSFTHTVKPSVIMFEDEETIQVIKAIEKSEHFDMRVQQKALFLIQMLQELKGVIDRKLQRTNA